MKRNATNDNREEVLSPVRLGIGTDDHRKISPPRKKLKFGVDAILGTLSDNDSSFETGNDSDDDLRHKGKRFVRSTETWIDWKCSHLLVRTHIESPASSSSSVSSGESSVGKLPRSKASLPANANHNTSLSDPSSHPPGSSASFLCHSIYGSSSYSSFNYLSSNSNNNNSNGNTALSRESSIEQQQQHQNLLHDRLLLQMAASNRQSHMPSFDGHPSPNGLWRPTLRPFIGK